MRNKIFDNLNFLDYIINKQSEYYSSEDIFFPYNTIKEKNYLENLFFTTMLLE